MSNYFGHLFKLDIKLMACFLKMYPYEIRLLCILSTNLCLASAVRKPKETE